MHMLHMNTKYQDMREAQSHSDGLAVLAVLLVVRKGLCDSMHVSRKRVLENRDLFEVCGHHWT